MKSVIFGIALLSACGYAQVASAQFNHSSSFNDTLRYAKDAAVKFCGALTAVPSDSRTSTRKAFESFSGNNIILRILEASKSSQDIGNEAREQLSISWLVGLAWPLILGFILALVWFICCWSTCGCCRCCRCCVRKRSNRWCKLVLLIPLLCACGYLAAAAVTFHGNNLIDDGSNSLLCASADLLDTVLSGKTYPYFIGIVPALDTFQGIALQLDANSPLITGIVGLLNKTAAVSKSVYVAGQTLQQLSDAMSDTKTVYPATSNGTDDLMHKCVFCEDFGATVQPVFGALAGGVGSALARVRQEVQNQLTGDNLNQLRSSLQDATAPMGQAQDALVQAFDPFVRPGQYDRYEQYYDGQSSATYTVISVLIADCALILLCGGCTFGLCICCEKDRKREEAGRNPYLARNHRCACFTFCCNWHYSVLTFIIGGVLWLVLFPVSSLCVTLEDVDKTMLLNIMPALGLKPSNDTSIGFDIIDRCLSIKSQALYSNSSRNLFDVIQVPSNGSYSSLRNTVLDTAIDPINEQFSGLSAALHISVGLANSPGVVQLKQKLQQFKIDMMTLPDPIKMQSSPYNAMLLDTATSSGSFTSMACSTNITLGIDDFFNNLTTLGTAVSLTSCSASNAQMATCNYASTDNRFKACDAGKALLALKMQLKRNAVYKCNVFRDPGNPDEVCDVYNMVKDPTGVWTNTCLFPDGTMRVVPKSCTLDEFSTYISKYSQRVGNVMSYLDDAVNSSTSDIDVGLRNLVSTAVVQPILSVLDGFDCTFMLQIYRVFIDGLCYQMGGGIRAIANAYVSCGFLAFSVAFFAYILFRYTVDNYNVGMKEEANQAGPAPPAIA